MTASEIAEDYWALRKEIGAVWVERDFVKVSGPDAFSFLQGQLSQELSDMASGDSKLSFLLSSRGKIDALVRVSSGINDDFIVDTDSGFGHIVQQRLEEFKFRVDCELSIVAWKCLSLRGPNIDDYYSQHRSQIDRDYRMVLRTQWVEWPGIDLLGEDIEVPTDVRLCNDLGFEAVRIEMGIPAMGREIDERTIPQETGIVDRSVNFDKGCYTGQELVARIDSRGHVNRYLRALVFESSEVAVPEYGDLYIDGKVVGVVTSTAWSPANGQVGLAYVRKEIAPGSALQALGDSGSVMARVEALPLLT